MKKISSFLLIVLLVAACASTKDTKTGADADSAQIADNGLDYELIVFETGFETWLASQPSIDAYTLEQLETENQRMIAEYNRRASNSGQYGKLYPTSINYDPSVHYGKEMNYRLYNYLEYFQEKYEQRL